MSGLGLHERRELTLLVRRKGIEARQKFVAPVGAWFSQVGRLHQVHHMWQYPYVVFLLLVDHVT